MSGGRRLPTASRCAVSFAEIAFADRRHRLPATGLIDRTTLLLFETAERAALLRVWIFDDAVNLASFVSLWQVLGNRKTFRIAEE